MVISMLIIYLQTIQGHSYSDVYSLKSPYKKMIEHHYNNYNYCESRGFKMSELYCKWFSFICWLPLLRCWSVHSILLTSVDLNLNIINRSCNYNNFTAYLWSKYYRAYLWSKYYRAYTLIGDYNNFNPEWQKIAKHCNTDTAQSSKIKALYQLIISHNLTWIIKMFQNQ